MKSRMSNFFLWPSASSLCNPFLMKKRHRSGVRSIATANEHANPIVTARGSPRMNSPGDPDSVINGRNDAMIVNVAARTGTAISVADLHAASSRETP